MWFKLQFIVSWSSIRTNHRMARKHKLAEHRKNEERKSEKANTVGRPRKDKSLKKVDNTR